jgi:predicted AlkP superfamily pyrophosphatase or phosphodiesterase
MKSFKLWGIRVALVIFIVAFSLASTKTEYKSMLGENKKEDYLIVISVDALNAKDYDVIKDLPNFKSLMANGSYAKEVVGIYPTLTYPSHTTISTGTYPDKHGIVNNKRFQIGSSNPEWYWYSKDIGVPTFYDLARKKGLTVGALAWPVTAGADIDYNYPEMWTISEKENEEELLKKNGTSPLITYLRKNYGSKLRERKQPELDNFITSSAVYLIKNKKPNVLLVHLVELDSNRHNFGADSAEVKTALERQDERIGKIVRAAKDAGIYNNTTFVVLGDHGFLNIDKKVNLNKKLIEDGLIHLDDQGKVEDWEAAVDACDGSAYVYLKDDSAELRQRVENLLHTYKSKGEYGIEEVYSKDELNEFRTNPKADFMLEAKEGYFFSNDVKANNVLEKSTSLGTHGYSPYKPNYNTFFMVSGAKAEKNKVVSSMRLVDEAPTMAKILGIEMKNIDGIIIEELVK